MIDALILCEGKFGTTTGKTANGLVRRSYKYRIVGIIDSSKAGQDAGIVLGGEKNGVPIFKDVADALSKTSPKCLIIGVATVGGKLPPEFRPVIADALGRGIDVISGLHEYLSEDNEFKALARKSGAAIMDIRRPPPLDKRHAFSDRARHIDALRIPVLGTDSAIGKRTTAWELTDALNDTGIKTVFVATGQTGLLQGAWYGVPLDSIPGDYMVGELENAIMMAYENERPQAIVIEGQGAASHPAYVCGSRAILAASAPSGIILQHAPKRETRNYHPELKLPMAGIERERMLVETFSGSNVIALTINHERMTKDEAERVAAEWEKKYGLPACDPLWQGCAKLVEAIRKML